MVSSLGAREERTKVGQRLSPRIPLFRTLYKRIIPYFVVKTKVAKCYPLYLDFHINSIVCVASRFAIFRYTFSLAPSSAVPVCVMSFLQKQLGQ